MKKFNHYLIALGLCLSVSMAYAQTPVANYPFDGSLNDVSANGNTGSATDIKLGQDRFKIANRAAVFNGVSSGVTAPNAAQLNTDSATIAFWMNPRVLPASGEAYIVSFGGWQERYKLSLPSHGKLVFTTNATGISDMDAGAANVMIPGVWVFVTAVHDGTNDIIYFNGVQVASKAVPGKLNKTTKPLGIGYDPIGVGSYFDGSLDNVMIYGTALTAAQITALYTAQITAPIFPQGVVANYPLTVNGAQDNSTYANHGGATATTATTNRFGFGSSAESFNGKTSSVVASNNAPLNSDFTTVTFWVNPASLPASGEVYLASFGGWQERWKISLPGHGKPVWSTKTATGNSDMDAGTALSLNQWASVSFVHDGISDKVYINGALKATKAVPGALLKTKYPLGIGWSPIDTCCFFNGSISDFKVYNYALTDAQIQTAYTTDTTTTYSAVNLVASFPFAGNAKDVTQFANNGVVTAATLTQDRFGIGSNAYSFNGAAGILVANSVQYNSDQTSVSMWVKPDSLPASGEVYLASFGGWQERWKISLPGHGKPVWSTNNVGSNNSDMDAGGTNVLVKGQWKHLVMTHDGVNDKIYMNGALVATKAVAGALKKTKYPLGIGYSAVDTSGFFYGSLDEVGIYNTALTAQQVTDLYNAQSVAKVVTDTLVASYPFSGNANDVSVFNNRASVKNAVFTKDRFKRANMAYQFNGNGEITAQNSAQLNSPKATVSFWIKVDSLLASGESYLFSFGGWQERMKLSLPGHGKVVFTTNNSNANISDMDAGGANALTKGVWKHIAVTHDTVNDKIYVNGVLANSKAVSGKLNSTTKALGIGYNPIDGGNWFYGALDDIQVYNVAMTDTQIAALYAAQAAAPVKTDTIPPTAPLNLSASVKFTDVSLSWLPSTDNVGVQEYNVYQNGTLVKTVGQTQTSILSLTQLTNYAFAVSAVDSSGNESTWSTVNVKTGVSATKDTIKPTKPSNFKGTPGSNSILISWTPSTDNVAVGGYVLTKDGAFVDSLSADKTSDLVSGLTASTPYTFDLYAYDLAGNRSDTADITVKTSAAVVTSEPGLVAYYPFEGNANDSTPYHNHGAIGGTPQFVKVTGRKGATGQCIVFSHNRDSILAPNAVQLISDYTTVSFWIRVDSITKDAESYILDFGHWSGRWKISLPQHTRIVWTTNAKTVQNPVLIVDMDSKSGNELLVGTWWYVTMVHDGTNNLIYINGQLVNSVAAPGTLNATAKTLGMGNNPVEGGQYFKGALDELKIYNKALIAKEVSNLYDKSTTPTDDLVADFASAYIKVVYPNPSVSELTIEHRFTTPQPLLVRVFDMSGRQVDQQNFQIDGTPNGGSLTMPVGKIAPGTYLLNFVLGGKNLGSVKFVKI